MARPDQPTAASDIGDAPGNHPDRLLDGVAQLLTAAGQGSPGSEVRRPPASAVFQAVLREIYGRVLSRLVGSRLTGSPAEILFSARSSKARGVPALNDPAIELQVESIAGLAASWLRESEGEWGEALQQLFEPVVARTARWSGGSLVLRDRTRASQRRAGVYYTPDWIVQRVLDWTLDRYLNSARRRWKLPLPAVYDPACGSGRFLVPALERLLDWDVRRAHTKRAAKDAGGGRHAVMECVIGRDIDPLAADLCGAALAFEQASRTRDVPCPPRIGVGDSLVARRLPPGRLRPDANAPLIVLGNPPFVNAIGRRSPAAQLANYRKRYSLVTGAADTAAFFLAHAAELAGPEGRVGLVLPRAVLNSPSAELLRGNLPHGLRPELIWAPDEPSAFAGAAVYFCVVVLGTDRQCRFSTDKSTRDESFEVGDVGSSNWWRELCRVRYGGSDPAAGATTRLGDVFEVRAGLTAGEAYELRDHIVDDRDGTGVKLLTTGLIDPGTALWGSRSCRFLKSDYRFPRVASSARDNPRLERRLARARRPKLVVAGLARRLECCLDAAGEFLASVSTLVITHPRDDLARLRALQEELSAPHAAELVYRELGAHALGGGNITIRKSFLLDYPLRDNSAGWK